MKVAKTHLGFQHRDVDTSYNNLAGARQSCQNPGIKIKPET
ncbi:hypothetical protein PL9214500475 [Planktothrix tepida PCC 9214]|uniref:Uncharacterized protein n=1 Tax=Planktothrix tepida PCC 9214 TaxID=671072 RepID=A0A1J1LMR3_9CYAN|nr:hypothetical protein PL9214500475 [Planktothrix tepida PCC 9214]